MTFETLGIPILGLKFFLARKFAAKDIPDLTGKTAVITGGTAGIGLESAIELARHGADVFVLGSNETRGRQAVETIHERTGKRVTYVNLNLGSIKASKRTGAEIKKKVKSIDILLLNAGIGVSYDVTVDGYESVFACNHLGHFAFVQEVKQLLTGSDVRVVVLSSASHYAAKGIDFDYLKKQPSRKSKKFGDVAAETNSRYEVSKLANVLFARALQRRVGNNVYVNTLHPGVIRTNIQDSMEAGFSSFGFLATTLWFIFNWVFVNLGINVVDGALTSLYCCTSPEIVAKGYRGQYFGPIAVPDKSSKVAEDERLGEELWKWSEQAIKDI